MERLCRGCSTLITPSPRENKAHPKQWCSMACRNKFQRKAGVFANTYAPRSSIQYADCGMCGELFVLRPRGRRPETLACYKPECQKQRTFRRQKAQRDRFKAEHGYSQKGERNVHCGICARCGREFLARKGTKYCSQPCWNAVIAEKYAHSNGGCGANRTRKLRERNAKVAPVNRRRIFERDGWRCHLCRKKINPKLKSPHPRSASIDHLIPLAHQGTHEPANVATACLGCNINKGDRGGGEQLMLVG